jgi:hypothetical protein
LAIFQARGRLPQCLRSFVGTFVRLAALQCIDSDEGKRMITRRFATVEPVFVNLRYNKRLSRFTLRGKAKVDGQFKRYAMMHNIEKLAGNGYAQ